jgi:hypothetical protein
VWVQVLLVLHDELSMGQYIVLAGVTSGGRVDAVHLYRQGFQ